MASDDPDHFARLLHHAKMAQSQAAKQGKSLSYWHCAKDCMWRWVHEVAQVDCFLPIVLGNVDIMNGGETFEYSLSGY